VRLVGVSSKNRIGPGPAAAENASYAAKDGLLWPIKKLATRGSSI